ncbi:hypothetical protein EG328_000091 [Venturia inaequalis]|nr:hypothetical protein EG328_000091 [Venturia inaequalis]
MIEELIDARYTVVQTVLEDQLSAWFGADGFQIIESPDDYARWKIMIPRYLTPAERSELRQAFSRHRRRGRRRTTRVDSDTVEAEGKAES